MMDHSSNTIKRSGSPPAPTQPPKRSKNGPETNGSGVSLPGEVWAAVMENLEFSSVLSLCATSRVMNYQAAPLVTVLRIHKSCQMHASVGRRFRDVRDIYFYSFYNAEDGCIDSETCQNVVPFLSNSFGNLERIFFGSHEFVEERSLDPFVPYHVFDHHYLPNNLECVGHLIGSLSVAFRCGALPSSLVVQGLRCPRTYDIGGDDNESLGECEGCRRACEHFPLASVAAFERGGSSKRRIEIDRTHYLDVCLEKAELMQILESRPGGKEVAHSKTHLFELLSRCHRTHLYSPAGKGLFLISYSDDDAMQLKQTFSGSGFDISKVTPFELADAIIPENIFLGNRCIVLESGRMCLRDIGISDIDVFGLEASRLQVALEFVPQIVALCEGFKFVHMNDWLTLMEEMVYLEGNNPIQEFIDAGAIRRLVEHHHVLTFIPKILRILLKIFEVKTNESIAAVMEALPSFGHLIHSAFYLADCNCYLDACKVLIYFGKESLSCRYRSLNCLADCYRRQYGEEKKKQWIKVWKSICFNEDMPLVKFSELRLDWFRIRNLILVDDEEIIKFACLALEGRLKEKDRDSSTDLSKILVRVLELLVDNSTELQANALRVFDKMIESRPYQYMTRLVDAAIVSSSIESLSARLNDVSDVVASRACRCICYLLQTNSHHVMSSNIFYLLVKSMAQLSINYECNELTPYEHWLLLSVEDEFEKHESSTGDFIKHCKKLDAKFIDMYATAHGDTSRAIDTFENLINCAARIRIKRATNNVRVSNYFLSAQKGSITSRLIEAANETSR